MNPTRRAVLGAALAPLGASAIAGVGNAAQQRLAVPWPANELGMRRLAFEDTFTTLNTIDRWKSGASGYKWYTRAPWGYASAGANDFSMVWEGSNRFLRVTPSVNNVNWSLSTMDPATRRGQAFRYGYIEARMKFVTPPEPNWSSGSWAFAWPSVWGITDLDLASMQSRTVELDVMEACNGWGRHVGVVHDIAGGTRWSSADSVHNLGVEFNQWHTYAARWTSNSVSWYFDGGLLSTQNWGAGGPNPLALLNHQPVTWNPSDVFAGFANANMVFALGSGLGAPFDVAWVRIWQW